MHVALIAHDEQKSALIEFTRAHEAILGECECVATGTTGKRINEATALEVERVASGPLGGDIMIGAEIAKGNCDAVIFLRDPLIPHPHEPDIAALVRICDVYDVPLATNLSSAHAMLAGLANRRASPMDRRVLSTQEGGQNKTMAGGKLIAAALVIILFVIVAATGSSSLIAWPAFSITALAVSAAFAIRARRGTQYELNDSSVR